MLEFYRRVFVLNLYQPPHFIDEKTEAEEGNLVWFQTGWARRELLNWKSSFRIASGFYTNN